MTDSKIPENIEDKLSKVKYVCDLESHLNPDQNKCLKCKNKSCTHVCPANVYTWNEQEKVLTVNYENCLECGACRIACDKKCIDWKYPKPGCGVTFKLG